jgi:hypothetical protein
LKSVFGSPDPVRIKSHVALITLKELANGKLKFLRAEVMHVADLLIEFENRPET